MKRELIDDSLWFVHKDGSRFYPWLRYSKHHGRSSFWVSDGSNLIEDAIPISTIADLVMEVFSRGRSVWLFDNGKRAGLYRFGYDAMHSWGASAQVTSMALKAGAPEAVATHTLQPLPPLEAKALADTGFDLITGVSDGWFNARISGTPVRVGIRQVEGGTLLATPEPGSTERIGLSPVSVSPPDGMQDVGCAESAVRLYESLRLLHSLQANPAAELSARVEARLAVIPATERTREVRQRIGQDVFRDALMDLWRGRCALSGLALNPTLLRASHAKPWSEASDQERLDPFNGLLLAVHYDVLFDRGLIAFDDTGVLLARPELSPEVMSFLRIEPGMKLTGLLPGHVPYLRLHRLHVAQLP